ncbi:unnamed protein product [Prorocentrum cordatum]|uniref:Uncharacterized protein n=1 Tax=Prorocentrum cordatum TaxID=2364126 RepID=A0ABN9TLK0_9DINO|nr:unnamed protein product [Polarella glacialis]
MLKLPFLLFTPIGAVCAERWSFLGCWNPHSLSTAYRLDEVSAVLRNVGIIGLPGTGVRSWQGEAHHAASAPYHHTVQFGWARSRLVTKACGCAIMINKTWFAKKDLRQIPSKGGNVKVYKDTCDQLLRWAKQEFLNIPQRYTPVICMDLNSSLVAKANSDVVGAFGAEPESVCGSAVHEWLSTVGLIAINTQYDCGHTFEGTNGTSQIDYVCIPAAAAPLVSWTKAWRRSAQAGGSMPAVLDHIPIVLKMKMAPPIVLTPLRVRWGRAKLSQAALTGEGREAFLDELQYELQSHRASFEVLESREVTTGHASLLMSMIRTTALKHFSQAPASNELVDRMTNEKWRMLKARRTLLGDVAKLAIATKAYTKALKSHRRKSLAERRRMPEEDLAHAWKVRDMAAVPRLSRALAGTGIGIKNRNYRAHPSFSPSVSERAQFLELPPLRGGLAGAAVSVPWRAELAEERYKQLKDVDESATPDNYEVPEHVRVQALKDFKMTAKAIRRTMLVRFSPAWSAPAEVYKILLGPAWINTPGEYWKKPTGVGSRPEAIMNDNATTPDPCAKSQLLHLAKYGEASFRLQALQDQLEERALARLAGEEENADADVRYAAAMTGTKRSRLTVIIDAVDDRCAVRSGSGGFVGDASEPEISMGNYHHAVRAWSTFERLQTAGAMAINFSKFPAIDASMGAFMDDIFKTALVDRETINAEDIAAASKRNDMLLDQALAARMCAQNRSKQDVVPALRSRQLTRQVVLGLRRSGCRAGYELKHLRAWFNAVGSNASELKARLQALNRGWTMVRGFWGSHAPKRVKRLMFISLVSGAGLSGTASMAWAESENRAICSALAKKLRYLMSGAAAFKGGQVRSLTSREVYRYWQLAPLALEATVQRLQAWQSVFRNPANHAHFLSVFFGAVKWELEAEFSCPPSLTPAGDVNDRPGLHPWLLQFKKDMQIVLGHPEAEDFARAWSGEIDELMLDPVVNSYFLAFDPRSLRTAFHATQWRPPASLADSVPAELDGEDTSRAALIAHVTQSKEEGHGGRSIFHSITPASVCINCGTVHQNRSEAVRHLARPWHAGRCLRNNTAYPYEFKDTHECTCMECGVARTTYASFRGHLCSHIPPAAGGLPIAAVEPRNKDRKLQAKDDGLRELLLLTMRSRAMWGMLTKTIIIDDGSNIAKAMQEEPRSFSENAKGMWEQVKRMKDAAKQAKGANDKPAEVQADKDAAAATLALRELAPPTATMFCAMVEAPAVEEVGRANRQTLEAWSTATFGDPPGFVKLCRLENCRQQDKVKIAFSTTDQAKENILTDSFKQLDCVATSGTAPSGYMEDELSAWIDGMDSREPNYLVLLSVVDDRSDA